MAKIQITGWQCERCGGTWVPREAGREPRACPVCKSPYWNKARTRGVGKSDGGVDTGKRANAVTTSLMAKTAQDVAKMLKERREATKDEIVPSTELITEGEPKCRRCGHLWRRHHPRCDYMACMCREFLA